MSTVSKRLAGQTLYSVQVFRGLAALLVVLFHITQFISKKYGVAPLGGFFFCGFAGMHLFFVLSGYIIFFIHREDVGRPRRVFAFARKRITRIYPTYWVILAVYSVVPLLSGKLNWAGLFHNAVLFGEMPHRFIVPTAWSLWHEMMFYALFGLLILAGRSVYLLMAAWLAGIVLVQTGFLPSHFPVATHPFNILFLMGLAVAAATFKIGRWRCRNEVSLVLAGAGAMGFAGMGFYSATESTPEHIVPWDTWPYILGFGLASALLLLAPLAERIEEFFACRKILLFLGDASYSIYLLHYPLVKLLVTWLRKLPPGSTLPRQWVADVGLLLVTGIVIVVGSAFYRKVEAPLLGYLRRRAVTGRWV